MFYGTKEEFEKQKHEFMVVAQRLWMTEPFYFKRSDYFDRVVDVVRHVEMQIQMNCLSWSGGEEILKYKTAVLNYQRSVILNNKIYSKWVAEQKYKHERAEEFYKLYTKIIGFLSGIGQVTAGVGICVSTGGSATVPGAAMILQGLNNIYENGYYLAVYEEASGPLREAYHYTANKAGYGGNQADIAYGTIDLVLSGYGMARRVSTPREKSWNLFGIKSRQTDYVRGVNDMTKPIFMLEIISDEITVLSLMPAFNENDLRR
ncbi:MULTISPECIES: DUF4225 domain-containing protein [Enterobacterales]|uniref:DUF4225 domain-containing protein n=1 Tax=Enterobacterales TaxID=91347 RepID=UPI002ED9BFB2